MVAAEKAALADPTGVAEAPRAGHETAARDRRVPALLRGRRARETAAAWQ